MNVILGSGLLTCALALSLLIKIEYEVDYFKGEHEQIQKFTPEKYFEDTQFKFVPMPGTGEFIGINGNCTITIGVSGRDGDADAIFRSRYPTPEYKIRYLYKGVLSTNPGYLRAQFEHYVQMLKVAVGRQPQTDLILHIAMTDACQSADFAPIAWK
ncbi:hypothetical protein [Oryzifoliimicrobium ureilyticus]|uniref:hypothetical protein n=1 Tax=Oryzifoliimicrobium ureilyticus TaxID=3113724 RepID=UPI003076278D